MNWGNILDQWADRTPEKEAIIFQDTSLTYKEMNERVNALSRELLNFGIGKGDRVALLSFNCHQFMEVFFACGRLGAIFVPLNFRLVGRELQYQLNDSEPKILFLGKEFQNVISQIREQLHSISNYVVIDEKEDNFEAKSYEDMINSTNNTALRFDYKVDFDDDFIIVYTSGTTGHPKGALLSQKNVLFTSLNQIIDFQCTTRDVTLTMSPMFHVGGLFILTLPMLHIGGTVVIMKAFDPVQALRLIEEHRVSVVFGVPAMWGGILRAENIGTTDISSLRITVSGGASQPLSVLKKIHDTFDVPLTEGYGLSEASSCSCLLRWEDVQSKAGSIGKPFVHNSMKVVNENGDEVMPGEVGEIIQAGPTVMRGYFNNPQATAETIVNGWLYTGDLATVDEDGFVYIKDRKKDMIISGGENIYPVEIEQVLYMHEKIAEAAVIGVPDDKWGESVLATIVLYPGQEMTSEEVINYCKNNLASYKKPRIVEFVDTLPSNPSGKVLKTELRKQYQLDSHTSEATI